MLQDPGLIFPANHDEHGCDISFEDVLFGVKGKWDVTASFEDVGSSSWLTLRPPIPVQNETVLPVK